MAHKRLFKVGLFSMSQFEKEALAHYRGSPSSDLIKALRGVVMLFETLLPELWKAGVRMRIAPLEKKITDLPEFANLKRKKSSRGQSYDETGGLYSPDQKLIAVWEHYLLESGYRVRDYGVVIHEFAHAIYYELLTTQEKAYIRKLYGQEQKIRPNGAYRLTNEFEFFAEGFCYYVTPQRRSGLLVPDLSDDDGETIEDPQYADIANLKSLNLQLYIFLEQKFGEVLDPDLVSPQFTDEGFDTLDKDEDSGLYLPTEVIDGGLIEGWEPIEVIYKDRS